MGETLQDRARAFRSTVRTLREMSERGFKSMHEIWHALDARADEIARLTRERDLDRERIDALARFLRLMSGRLSPTLAAAVERRITQVLDAKWTPEDDARRAVRAIFTDETADAAGEVNNASR